MTLLFIEGFDHFADEDFNNKWDSSLSTILFNLSNTYPRRANTNYLEGRSTSQASIIYKNLSASKQTLIVGFAWQPRVSLTVDTLLSFLNADGVQLSVSGLSDGSLRIVRGGGGGTVLATSDPGVATIQTWHYVEFKATIDHTAGSYELKINGATLLSASGVDTQEQSANTITRIAISVYQDHHYDDLYICDTAGAKNNDFLGDIRVDTLYPDGAGNYTQWDPSTGSNYQCVDEQADMNEDTDYVSTDVANEIDTYTFDDLDVTAGTIHGVVLNIAARKDDAGTRKVDGLTRIGGTDYQNGNEITLTDGYRVYQQIWEDNPDDSAAWEEADVNGAEFGVKLTA